MRWRRLFIFASVFLLNTFLSAQVGSILCLLIGAGNDGIHQSAWEFVLFPYQGVPSLLIIFLPAGLISASQVFFLLPSIRPDMISRGRGKPILLTAIGASLCAAFLIAGILYGIESVICLVGGAGRESSSEHSTVFKEILVFPGFNLWWWPFVFASWVLWTPLIYFFTRRHVGHRLHERLVGILFAGTVLEVLVVIPIDVMVRKRTECYCGESSFFALCMAVCASLWLAGPAAVLALTSKRRRWWADSHCTHCGYEKGPTPGAQCPECGHEWIGAVDGPARPLES